MPSSFTETITSGVMSGVVNYATAVLESNIQAGMLYKSLAAKLDTRTVSIVVRDEEGEETTSVFHTAAFF